MGRLFGRLVASIAAAATLALGLGAAALAESKLAVVISVDTQQSEAIEPALGADLDAEMVSDALRSVGYEVRLVSSSVDRGRIRRTLSRLVDDVFEAGPDTSVVFYFVGNAIQVSGRTYLLGEDARAADAITLSGSGFPADEIATQLGSAGARDTVIVIDAATPTGVTNRFALTPGVRTFDAPTGGAVIISNQADTRAPERRANLSPFALAFVEDLVITDTPFRTAVRTMRGNVSVATGGGLTPWHADRTRASFVLGGGEPDMAALDDASTRSMSPSSPDRGVLEAPSPAAPDRDIEPQQIQKVTVFYGTERTISGDRTTYTNQRSAILNYGAVDVTIPPKHKPGMVEMPSVFRFEFEPNPDKHFTIERLAPLQEEDFVAQLSTAVSASTNKQALVFIHGFNTSFDSAAFRTAQLYHDLKYDGAPVFYAWPSRNVTIPAPWDYARDQTSADRTVSRLEEFLLRVRNDTGAQRMHIIAHSMGNHALMQALDEIAEDLDAGDPPPFDEIIMSAPDVDREQFKRTADDILPTAKRITVYASSNDEAMKMSRRVNGEPRLGDRAGGVLLMTGIDYIDASNVRTEMFSLGHDYFATQASILSDIGTILRLARGPSEREGLKTEQLPPEMQVYYSILGPAP